MRAGSVDAVDGGGCRAEDIVGGKGVHYARKSDLAYVATLTGVLETVVLKGLEGWAVARGITQLEAQWTGFILFPLILLYYVA